MAPSPLSTTPTSLEDLPDEVCRPLTLYLGNRDLRSMRFLSEYWNVTCKATLRKRKRFTFNLNSLNKLIQFNETFTEYTPTDDIAAGHFCFTLPALDTAAAREHLDTFVQRFGPLVTSLSVNLFKESRSFWDDSDDEQDEELIDVDKPDTVRDTVLAHVTLLLQTVKGQLQHLELLSCADVRSCAVGDDPFPRLWSLTVGNGSTESCRIVRSVSDDHEVTAREANCDEGCILVLSSKVPAIQRFESKALRGSSGGDPLFLATVLRNLVQVNSQLEVKLRLELVGRLTSRGGCSALVRELMTVAVRIVELDLDARADHEALELALQWTGAQSDWLRKLTVSVRFRSDDTWLGGLRLPSLAALEELEYVQKTVGSLLQYDSPDYFPSLRRVTTAFTGNEFTVALPQVTDLTLVRSRFTELVPWKRQGIYGGAVFRLPPFPDLETLTCQTKFVDLGSISQLTNLRRFTLTLDHDSEKIYAFWKRVTHGAPKLTMRQILALPEPSDDEVRGRAEPCFSNLKNFKEFNLVVCDELTTTVNLDALLWLSKTKRLQRLEKLELSDIYGKDNADRVVSDVYLTELRNYHNHVFWS